jgi:hypothetical protein
MQVVCDRICFDSKLRRDNPKLSICRECKETRERCAQSSARNLNLRKDLVQVVHRSEIRLKVEAACKKLENRRRRMPRRREEFLFEKSLGV